MEIVKYIHNTSHPYLKEVAIHLNEWAATKFLPIIDIQSYSMDNAFTHAPIVINISGNVIAEYRARKFFRIRFEQLLLVLANGCSCASR